MLGSLSLNNNLSARRRGMIRCLFGVVGALLFATVTNTLTPYMSALFAVMFLDKGKQSLGVLKSVALILGLFVLGLFGLVLGSFVQDFAIVTILVLGLAMYWTFRLVHIPEALRMLFLILTLLLPYLSLTAAPLGDLVLMAMVINLAIALVFTQLAFLLFPEPPEEAKTANTNEAEGPKFDISKIALNGLVVLMPVVLYFYLFRPNTMVITLVFILILGLDPLIYKSKKTLVFIVANFLGGAFAVLAYNLLTVTPTFSFYIFLIIVAGIYFTYHMHSDKATAPIFAIAYRAFFVVMGTIASSSDEAGDLVVTRLFGIGLAIVYVILAYKIMTYFNDPRLYENETA